MTLWTLTVLTVSPVWVLHPNVAPRRWKKAVLVGGLVWTVSLIALIGVLLSTTWTVPRDWWFALVLFVVLRPIATYAAMWRSDATVTQKRLVAFFGIRGIGSVYYLAYAIGEGLDAITAERLSGIVLTTVAMSLLIHSNVASPLLSRYEK